MTPLIDRVDAVSRDALAAGALVPLRTEHVEHPGWAPFLVRRPTLDNFQDLLLATDALSVPFTRYLFNSVFVVVTTVLLQVLICSMCAYPLSKARVLPGRNVIFGSIVAALMFAPQVTRIPQYLVVQKLGLIDTYGALILPAIAWSYGLFMMKQFMDNSVPNELIEAARVDGAPEWTIFWKIVMPNVAPAWNTLLIFGFIQMWNDSFSPLVFTRSEAMKTVSVAMISLTNGPAAIARQGAQAAAAFLMTAPTITVFLLRQAKVIQTMAHSGIKA
ncbi:MAG: carbohydrate ABC transporter permease [Proteobacteria bacterium]|nr:carbohydrate ABC transporter permease [Pseudomonadota bacterium]